ncbi:hypothetical protein D3C71_827430 [compost metagenome]
MQVQGHQRVASDDLVNVVRPRVIRRHRFRQLPDVRRHEGADCCPTQTKNAQTPGPRARCSMQVSGDRGRNRLICDCDREPR